MALALFLENDSQCAKTKKNTRIQISFGSDSVEIVFGELLFSQCGWGTNAKKVQNYVNGTKKVEQRMRYHPILAPAIC